MESHKLDQRIAVLFYFVGLILFITTLLFSFTEWITNLILFGSVLFAGYHVLLEGVVETIEKSCKKKGFYPNTHILMGLSAIGAMLMNSFSEAAILILIFAGAHFLEEYVEGKSKKDITALLKLKPLTARRMDKNGVNVVRVEELSVGDKLVVLPGDQVPIDGKIVRGAPSIDESNINGESLPRDKNVGDLVYGGTVNLDYYFEMEVTKNSDDTLFSKILGLVENSQKNTSKIQTFISKYEPYYVIFVMFFAILTFIFLLLFNFGFEIALYRTLVLLVSLSPCAIAVSVTPATLAAVSFLARRNILFKQSIYLMYFYKLEAIAFDKTGTLTTGKMSVKKVEIKQENKKELLEILYVMEKTANHPIAKALVSFLVDYESNLELNVENKTGIGLETIHNGNTYRVGKPSLVSYQATLLNIDDEDATTKIYYTCNDELVGIFYLEDELRENVDSLIQYLNESGIETVMITGDNYKTADVVAKKLGVVSYYAEVLPHEKYQLLTLLQSKYNGVAMVGDGVNDAVALANADVAIAMGSGSDIAIDSSDIVLMKNDIAQVQLIHKTSKRLDKIIKQNLVFSIGVILILFVLNFLGITTIFTSVLGHESSTFLILLNSLRLLFTNKNNCNLPIL